MSPILAMARTEADATPEDPAAADMSLPDSRELIRHPDGYYWLGADGRMEVGPYASAEEALADLHSAEEEAVEPEGSLPEAELALGLSDWVDPDTGELAEATHTRIEDH
jgi:hypothetical protein